MSAARHPSMRSVALAAKAASRTLAPLELDVRDAALEAIARALDAAREPLLAANREDIASATSGAAALPAGTLARLKMDDAKLDEMIAQVRSVAALPDPLGRTLDAIRTGRCGSRKHAGWGEPLVCNTLDARPQERWFALAENFGAAWGGRSHLRGATGCCDADCGVGLEVRQCGDAEAGQ